MSLINGLGSFLGQLDWKSPYTYLGIFGAIGAPSTVYGALRWCGKLWNTAFLAVRHPAILKDFYYESRDLGYRVMEDGITFVNVRHESITAEVSKLASVPLTYRWTGEGEVGEKVEPNTLEIRDRPRVAGKASTRRSIVFEKPLEKKQRKSYTVILTCKVTTSEPEKFVGSSSARRVDKLILRVAFPLHKCPSHVTYRLLDSDGIEKEKEILDCADYLTGEYRKEIRYPKPFFEHRIEWE